jgi:hypothetical protein
MNIDSGDGGTVSYGLTQTCPRYPFHEPAHLSSDLLLVRYGEVGVALLDTLSAI